MPQCSRLSICLLLFAVSVGTASRGDTNTSPHEGHSTRSLEISQEACFDAFVQGDADKDDWIDRSEYIDVVNRLSNGAWSNVAVYDDLPETLRGTFINLYLISPSNGRSVAFYVFGSKEGQDADSSQQDFLELACDELTDVIEAETGAGIITTAAPTTFLPTAAPTSSSPTNAPTTAPTSSSPTNAPTTAPTTSPTATFSTTMAPTITSTGNNSDSSLAECLLLLSLANMEQDEVLEKEEYIMYLNFRTNDEYFNMTFDDLPEVLQVNYEELALENGQPDVIDVVGLDEYPDVDNVEFLQQICTQTGQVLLSLATSTDAPTTIVPTTTAPTAAPNTTPSPTGTPPAGAIVADPSNTSGSTKVCDKLSTTTLVALVLSINLLVGMFA